MPLRIRDTSVVPPQDWSYYVSETGYMVKTKNFYQAYPMIVEHCQSNNVAVPSQQTVIDYFCNNLTIPCYESDTHAPLVNAWTLGLPKPPRIGCCGKR